MAANRILNKDGATLVPLTITNTTETYSDTFDLGDSERAGRGDLEFVVDLSAMTGTLVLELSPETAAPVDTSTAPLYTYKNITATGTYILPIPADMNTRYVGITSTSQTVTGTATVWIQSRGN